MKRVLSVLMICALMCCLFAGCNNEDPTPSTNPSTPSTPSTPSVPSQPSEPTVQLPATALELLQGVWTSYFNSLADDQKFPVAGGFSDNYEEMIMDNAGPVKLELEGSLYSLFVAEENYAHVEEASNVMHMMNGNTFTAGALKLKEGTDIAAFTQSVRDMIAGNHWMCGFPDRFVVASVGNYVVIVYGQDGVEIDGFKTSEIVTPFINALTAQHPTTEILFNEQIAG